MSAGAEVDQEANFAIRKTCLEAWAVLLQDFRQFLFFMGDGVPIFNAEEFLSLHKRRATGMLEDAKQKKRQKWFGIGSHPSDTPFLCQFLSTHVFAMFLEGCQYPTVFHVFLSVNQSQGSKQLGMFPPRSRDVLRLPGPSPLHPYYPNVMPAQCVYAIKKQIKIQRLRAHPLTASSSSSTSSSSSYFSWRTSTPPKLVRPAIPLDSDPLPFPVRVCDWLETKREWSAVARDFTTLYASQPPIIKTPYAIEKHRRGVLVRRFQTSEVFQRFQTYLTYLFLFSAESKQQTDKMHALLQQCKRSFEDKFGRRCFALLLGHPANLVSQKSRLSPRKFAAMSQLVKKFLDSCLKDNDFKSAVSALTAGSAFFCVRIPTSDGSKAASPQAQSLTAFLSAEPAQPATEEVEEAAEPEEVEEEHFLESSVKDHAIFLHAALWGRAFREAVKKQNFQRGMPTFENDGHQDKVQLLGMFINKMLSFGCKIPFVMEFIQDKGASLNEADSKMLQMLALNIVRAR